MASFLFTFSAFAAPPPIDLQASVDRALQTHPGIQSLRLSYEALLERPAQERALPDPMLGYTFMYEDVVTANGPIRGVLELSQEIPFQGKRKLRAGVSALEAAAAAKLWLAAQLEVEHQVRVAFYDLFRVDRSLAVVQEEADVLDRLESVARSRYANGLAGQGDALRAQTERSRLEERLLLLAEEREATAARFNRAVGLTAASPVGAALTLPRPPAEMPSDAELYRLARALRPEVAEARQLAEAGRLAEDLAKREFYPDFRVGLQWNRIGSTSNPFSPDPGQDAYMLMVGVTLPVWRGKLQSGVREAQASTAAAEAAARDREIGAEAEVRAALAALRTRRDLVQLYNGTLVPQADSTLRAAEAAYRNDAGDFLAVLDSERSLLGMRLAHAVVLGEMGAAVADLERSVGASAEDWPTALAAPSAPEGEGR